MIDDTQPLISCLCVTEGRPAFMPWLLWCFDRQRWPNRELVIVDSSPEPFDAAGCSDVRVLAAPPRTGVAAKRNLALKAASGAIVTWFDDDDWQHPDRLRVLAEALAGGAPYAGAARGWFVDLARQTCAPYRGLDRRLIFNSAGFRRDVALGVRFPEELRRASDSRWMQRIAEARAGRPAELARDDLFFWLCHGGNLSNPATSRRCTQPLDALRRRIGPDGWGDTDAALDALRARLGEGLAAPRAAQPRRVVSGATLQPARSAMPIAPLDPGAAPTVSLMIKATVLDAPYLDTMARHMVAQSRYAFAERVIVVDMPARFAGKYQSRPRGSAAELDSVLERLRADGVIDRVQTVDPAPATVREVLECYFGAAATRVPTHAATGGPIYATLFGLEAMSSDYVLQMDADVFFYSGAASWVGQALACMAADARLWLMMTHPGPPAGPAGASLSGLNARRAAWDAAMRIWRFRSATTRYFLCDRRALRGRLQPLAISGGHAPLEQCLSQALQRHGAFRGCLGDLTSWHLHVWNHGQPFADWAPKIAAAIADGRYPALQRGAYDLRLDRPHDRMVWGRLLEQPADAPRAEAPATAPTRPAQPASAAPPGANAPLAVIIPVRNRAGSRLRNTLNSLQWQTSGPPAQAIVVSSGSSPEIDRELAAICAECGAELLVVGDASLPWNKPFALNCGIRATRPEIAAIMTMDADMILAPNFLEAVGARLGRQPPALVLCRSSDLPAGVTLPSRPEQLLAAFDRLRAVSRLRGPSGTGGIQAAPRSFFFEIRGYDEDLAWWGAMDGDVVNRARLMKLDVAWIEDQTTMLHQWHARKESGLALRGEVEQARRAWRQNHQLVRSRSQLAQRNPRGWGGYPDL
jgi:glycosyltransferase involved in cell wall biosynthesis